MNTLNLRNFDDELKGLQTLSDHPEPEPALKEAVFTETEVQAMLEEMRARALEEGRHTGLAEARTEMEDALNKRVAETFEALTGPLTELSSAAEQRRAEMEQTIVDLALGVSERLIPEILDVHAPDLVATRIRSGVRMASGQAGLTIRVTEDVAPRISELLDSWMEQGINGMQVTIEPVAEMPVGAARLVWKNGYLDYDLDRACNALLVELREAAHLMTEQLGRTE
ncbi:MAG: FliH/SctL family protein [Brevirhabdus sp.]